MGKKHNQKLEYCNIEEGVGAFGGGCIYEVGVKETPYTRKGGGLVHFD